MKTPDFWYQDKNFPAALLAPLSRLYARLSRKHREGANPLKISVPVICIGNIVAGGAGKTPTALALAKLLQEQKIALAPFFLTRGYRGKVEGPERVDQSNDPALWGDEALLLKDFAPTIVSKDRHQGGLLAVNLGADCVIMDDGLQNYSLQKNISFCVIDGARGFGNREVIPQGPLRQPLEDGIALVDAFIMIGDDKRTTNKILPADKPLFQAELKTANKTALGTDQNYIAFCGIGYPEKFKASLENAGVKIVSFKAFSDHHDYNSNDLEALLKAAEANNARLITTRKDFVRLPNFSGSEDIDVLDVELVFKEPDVLTAFIRQKLS